MSPVRTTNPNRSNGRSGGVVDAPGKKHRRPPPAAHGVKHSDETIAKGRGAARIRKSGNRE